MAISPIVDTLPKYVEEKKSELIAKSILGAQTAKMVNLMSGIKGATTLNLLDTEVVFGDGAECGFDPTSANEISQRTLTPAYLKVNAEWCDKKLLNTYAQYLVKMAANQKTLPFEEDFVNGLLDGINHGIEKMIWQGDSDNGAECDGLIKILNADADIKVAKASGTSAYSAIKEVYASVPETALKDDLVVFVDGATYRQFIAELVDANLYHYDPQNGADGIAIPGTSVRVHKVDGLDGADKHYIVAARTSNIFYGVDGVNDAESFDLWFSADNRTFRFVAEMLVGVQVAYPNEVVLGSIAK